MSQYQQADPIAAEALVDLLGPKFYRFFSSRPGNTSEAEDMLQDLWLRIHRARHTYHPGEPLLPWVYAIALGVRVDYYRKRRRIASHETGANVLPETRGTRVNTAIFLRSKTSWRRCRGASVRC